MEPQVQQKSESDWRLRRQSEAPSIQKDTAKKIDVYHVFDNSDKILLVVLISIAASFAPLATQIYFPALSEVAREVNTTPQMVSLTMTSFLVAQAVTPSILSPLADVFGRRQILLYTMLLFVVSNLVATFVHQIEVIIVLRFLQAVGSASTSTIGSGIIADITTSSERGGYMGIFAGMRQFALALGPVLGGVLTGTLGYVSIFWTLFFSGAVVLLMLLIFLPETLRSLAGNGSIPLKGSLYAPLAARSAPWRKAGASEVSSDTQPEVVRSRWIPLRMFYEPMLFLFEKDIFCTLVYGALIFTIWSMVCASTSTILEQQYGLSTITIGLCFLPNAIGCGLGAVMGGKQLDQDYAAAEDSYKYSHDLPREYNLPKSNAPSDFPIEKARLHQLPIMSIVFIYSVIVYGFSVAGGGPLVVPLMAQFAIGYSTTVVLTLNNVLTVDLYPGNSASAASINNLIRYILAAVGVGLTEVALEHISPQWFFLILGGSVIVASPMVVLQWRFGSAWRKARLNRLEEKENLKRKAQAAEEP